MNATRRSQARSKIVWGVQTFDHVQDLLGWPESRLLAVADSAGHSYRTFEARRVGTTKWRRLDVPYGELRALQSDIQRKILRNAPGIPDYLFGGIPGRSIIDNAEIHARAPMVLTIDIRDCFPSITNKHVYEVFAGFLGYHPRIAAAFTRATTFRRRLPQGAATSTMLANLALLPTHELLKDLADHHNVAFSAWVDDLAFSGRAPDVLIDEAIEILRVGGFRVARRKVRPMRRWREPTRVTGTVGNFGVSAGRDRIREVEREILALAARGTASPAELASVWGKIRHCGRLKDSQGRQLERIANRLLPEIVCEGRSPGRRMEYRRYRRPARRRSRSRRRNRQRVA